MPLQFTPESIHWAITHLKKFGDTDVFPPLFEIDAAHRFRQSVVDNLTAVDFEQWETRGSLKMMMPKPGLSFRAATQLDPLDSILYAASSYRFAAAIEAFRMAPEEHIACSYRLDPQPEGQLFSSDRNCWTDFHTTSKTLAETHQFVAILDVNDFYNQISLHRLQNALSSAGVEHEWTKALERFLTNVNGMHHSQGIPVGPNASIACSEATLADVDNFIRRNGYTHTRYVDDFRVFCDSEESAKQAFHDISEYLFTAHRLPLSEKKSQLISTEDFLRTEHRDPEEQDRRARQRLWMSRLLDFDWPDYDIADEVPEDEPPPGNDAHEALSALLDEQSTASEISLGLSRYVLRRARQLRTRIILQSVLDRMDHFAPAIRDVVYYIDAVFDRRSPQQVGERYKWLLEESGVKHLPLIQYWILWSISQNPTFLSQAEAFRLAGNSHPAIRDRMTALIAKAYRVIDWVRERKETWQNNSPWTQRAIIHASLILPQDERRHWLRPLAEGNDLLLKIVAQDAMNPP